MSKIWRWVGTVTVILLILGLALLGVAIATGGSVNHLMSTTDITDMTKFATREQLQYYLERPQYYLGQLQYYFHTILGK